MKNIEQITELVSNARSSKKSREFKQTFEVIISLKDIDTKKNDLNFNETIFLPHKLTNEPKICVIASGDVGLRAGKADADNVLDPSEVDSFGKDKRKARKIVRSYDFFMAETSAMPSVGKNLGRFMGPKGKMPTPIAPNAPIENLIQKYRAATRIRGKNQLTIATKVGDEDLDDKLVAENVLTVINALVDKLPNSDRNLKGIVIKLSMSSPIKSLIT